MDKDKRILGENAFKEIARMLNQLNIIASNYAEKNDIDAINFAISVELLKRAAIQALGKKDFLSQSKMQTTNKLIEIAADLFIDLSDSPIKLRSIHNTIDITKADLDALLGKLGRNEGPYN